METTPVLSTTAILLRSFAICARNWPVLAVWLPLTALVTFVTLFFPFLALLFAAVWLSYVFGRRARGEPATLIDGLGVAVRRFWPVLICSIVLGFGFLALVSFVLTLPLIAYLWARLTLLPAVLAFEDGSAWDALKRAWSLTGATGSRSLRFAAVMAVPLFIGSAAFLAGYLQILLPFISPEDGHNVFPAVVALWGSSLAVFLLWLPVLVAAQTLAYATLARPQAEAEKALA
jgi:hypothetical protein